MTASTLTQSSTLRTALKANALFSAVSGLALAVASGPIAALMGVSQPLILLEVGVALLPWAALVWWIATRSQIDTRWAWAVVAGDVLWIAGSIILLLTGIAGFSPTGRWLVLIVADIVGVFALWQGYGIWKVKS